MATHTTYIKLEKPLAGEKYNVNIVNKNNDIIDSEIHKLELKNQNQDNLLATKESLNNHSGNKNNPHNVTKSQVGLNNIDNTSDIDKPVSTAQQDAINLALSQSNHYTDLKIADLINGAPETLDTLKELADALSENETFMEALNAAIGEKADQIELNGHINNSVIHVTNSNKDSWNSAVEHISDNSNPHNVTKNDIGLSEVENKSSETIRNELSKENIVNALGFEPSETGGADGSSIDIPITLPTAGWTGEAAPYSQTVTVPQIRESMTPLLYFAGAGDDAQYAYSLITGYEAGYAQMIFYAADLPEADIDITLKGIPAQQLEYADNTVVVVVPADGFELNEDLGRYEQTIAVEGMTPGMGGLFDIVRSGPVLTLEESKIVASITDIIRMENAIKIVCLEPPGQQYMLALYGTFTQATEGTMLLAGMQGWFDRVEGLEDKTLNFVKIQSIKINVENVPPTTRATFTVPIPTAEGYYPILGLYQNNTYSSAILPISTSSLIVNNNCRFDVRNTATTDALNVEFTILVIYIKQ